MLKTIYKVLSYTTPSHISLLLLAYVVLLLAAIALSVTHSTALFAAFTSLSVMLWLPIARDLVPVCWSVAIKGRWPNGKSIKTAL